MEVARTARARLGVFTSISATTPAWELAKPPTAIPRPRTIVSREIAGAARLPGREVGNRGEDVTPLPEAVVHLRGWTFRSRNS